MPDRCVINVGDRGSGKSTTLAVMLLAYIMAEVGACLVVDPPGTLVELLLAHLVARGQEHRVFICYADPNKANGKYIQWRFLPKSKAADPLVRQNEDDAYIENLLTAVFGLRNEKDGTNKPYTDKYARLALRILMSISPQPRIDQVLELFDTDSELADAMLNAATDHDAVRQWRAAQARGGRDGKQWEMETGASQRLLTVLASAAMFPHDGDSFSFEDLIEGKGVLLLSLAGVPPTHQRALGVSAYVAAATANKRLFNRTGRKHKLVIAVDEVGAMRFDTPYMISSMREDRKYGSDWYLATQTLTDLPPENIETILGLSDHYWHNMSSGLDRAASDIVDKSFRSDIEFQRRDRALHDGWESVDTVSESESKSAGKTIEKHKEKSKSLSESGSKSVSHGFRAKYRMVTDITYKTWNLLHAETKAEIANLLIGHWIFRGADRWDRGHTTWPGDAWTFQNGSVTPATLPDSHLFSEKRVTRYEWQMRRAIARIRSRPQYSSPLAPWNPNQKETHSPDQSTPEVIRIPRTDSGSDAMVI